MEKVGKALAYWLRHKPDAIGIELDEQGWTDLEVLVSKSGFSAEQVEEAVRTCEKQRYTIKDGRIRANQGHSVPLKMTFKEVIPPSPLFHGTSEKYVKTILSEGLKPMGRHHVHLSGDAETAYNVANRRSNPKLLVVFTDEMHNDGIKFYQSENGVFLVDFVDPKYIIRY